ncbi:MAG: type II toxin-antitoxin system RelE/ParE family toxin [Defluviitaleaceae bacterium]|nr:type II toxin-antitoxin system RelE/ParE family toxin [Defluviitaleaceae bacterium]
MHDIYFYEDKDGNSPVFEYIEALSKRTDKDGRINLAKIQDYMRVLREYGKSAGEPYMKHLDDDIWELRPIRGRIFFASWLGNDFILLHHFQFMKTNKTPKSEIEKAKRNLYDIRERSGQQ